MAGGMVLASAARAATRTKTSIPVIEPDDDYINPIGEQLPIETIVELAAAHFVIRLARIIGLGDDTWPFF
ncbi:hypothetical protein CG716_05050 [Mycolicibacterium sphagni]|uniref:Uncharacterized protein n=1 Tax=Mycolicibacterium sphagni TaxID=1786 RepID=A0A255DR56_9MYCO|nr:hypothetical protein CG716_05050 [Mycolicibacterium sphagni]